MAYFSLSGNAPEERDLLQISVKGEMKKEALILAFYGDSIIPI
jgi:hypothetical protein